MKYLIILLALMSSGCVNNIAFDKHGFKKYNIGFNKHRYNNFIRHRRYYRWNNLRRYNSLNLQYTIRF